MCMGVCVLILVSESLALWSLVLDFKLQVSILAGLKILPPLTKFSNSSHFSALIFLVSYLQQV